MSDQELYEQASELLKSKDVVVSRIPGKGDFLLIKSSSRNPFDKKSEALKIAEKLNLTFEAQIQKGEEQYNLYRVNSDDKVFQLALRDYKKDDRELWYGDKSVSYMVQTALNKAEFFHNNNGSEAARSEGFLDGIKEYRGRDSSRLTINLTEDYRKHINTYTALPPAPLGPRTPEERPIVALSNKPYEGNPLLSYRSNGIVSNLTIEESAAQDPEIRGLAALPPALDTGGGGLAALPSAKARGCNPFGWLSEASEKLRGMVQGSNL